MATKLMEKFSEWGLSTDAVNTVLQDNNYWTAQVKDNVDLLTESAGQLGEGFSRTAEQIDLSGVSMKDAMAMMNSQQNPINVTCYAELKTEDNEVLARAVTKGQKSIDRRLHPTLQFGY